MKSKVFSKSLRQMLGRKGRDRVFDFLCVGVQKGGTTWLWQNCREHPAIRLPLVKEVHYFSHKHQGVYYSKLAQEHAGRARAAAERMRAKGLSNLGAVYDQIAEGSGDPSEDWYRKVFSVFPNNAVAGELSPDYFCLGHAGVSDIWRMNNEGRIIVFVRDPGSRILSSLNMALRKNSSRDQSRVVKQRLFLERGNYINHIPVWDEIFGKNVLYVPFGDIKLHPRETMKVVEKHIGVNAFDGYQNLGRPMNSWSGKFEIDKDVFGSLRDHIHDQRQYLTARFGTDFCSRI